MKAEQKSSTSSQPRTTDHEGCYSYCYNHTPYCCCPRSHYHIRAPQSHHQSTKQEETRQIEQRSRSDSEEDIKDTNKKSSVQASTPGPQTHINCYENHYCNCNRPCCCCPYRSTYYYSSTSQPPSNSVDTPSSSKTSATSTSVTKHCASCHSPQSSDQSSDTRGTSSVANKSDMVHPLPPLPPMPPYVCY